MTLPTSGQISMQQIAVELKLTTGQTISLNDPVARSLAGKSSGQISLTDFWGKNATPTPQPTGNYVSGGPTQISGTYYYGYIRDNVGDVPGPMGSANDLHYLGAYPVTAVISDAGMNMIFKVGGITSQPPMPYNTFRITVGSTIYDVPSSSLGWIGDPHLNGVLGFLYAVGAPILSPVGTSFKVEFLNK